MPMRNSSTFSILTSVKHISVSAPSDQISPIMDVKGQMGCDLIYTRLRNRVNSRMWLWEKNRLVMRLNKKFLAPLPTHWGWES